MSELPADLLEACRRGEAAAFRALVERYQDRVFALCAALAGADAEDLAQETFMRVHRSIRGFDPRGTARLSTWVLTIARRLCVDRARGARRRVEVPLGAAVLSVYVLRGGARVEASAPGGGVAVLGHGDRAIVADGTPPLAVRNAAPAPATPEKSKPRPGANDKRSNDKANDSHSNADEPRPIRLASVEPSGVLDKIKDCYEHALETNPKLAGRVMVEMKIRARDGKGKVDEAEVVYDESNTDDLNSPATEHCLLGAIAGTDFPAPGGDGELIVRYPFVLKAAEGD